TVNFPSTYVGKYFFSDYCAGWIKTIDLGTKAVATFATGVSSPTDVETAPDGSLYYIARGAGQVVRVRSNTTATATVTARPTPTVTPRPNTAPNASIDNPVAGTLYSG